MDVKISPSIWADPDIERVEDPNVKLGAFWLLTNSGLNIAGYAEITPRRFVFETACPSEALDKTFEGLAKVFRRIGKGYWMPKFIQYQIGRGESLVRNHYCRALLKDMLHCPEDVVAAVLLEYPELKTPYTQLRANIPLGRASQALPKHQSRAEPSRAEPSRAEQSRAEPRGGSKGGRSPRARAGAVLVANQPWAAFALRIGTLFGRRPTTAWAAAEAAIAEDLHRLGAAVDEDLAALEAYYRAQIPEREDHRRRDLGTLLNNWSGEIDRARKFVARKEQRENGEGLSEL